MQHQHHKRAIITICSNYMRSSKSRSSGSTFVVVCEPIRRCFQQGTVSKSDSSFSSLSKDQQQQMIAQVQKQLYSTVITPAAASAAASRDKFPSPYPFKDTTRKVRLFKCTHVPWQNIHTNAIIIHTCVSFINDKTRPITRCCTAIWTQKCIA